MWPYSQRHRCIGNIYQSPSTMFRMFKPQFTATNKWPQITSTLNFIWINSYTQGRARSETKQLDPLTWIGLLDRTTYETKKDAFDIWMSVLSVEGSSTLIFPSFIPAMMSKVDSEAFSTYSSTLHRLTIVGLTSTKYDRLAWCATFPWHWAM